MCTVKISGRKFQTGPTVGFCEPYISTTIETNIMKHLSNEAHISKLIEGYQIFKPIDGTQQACNLSKQ